MSWRIYATVWSGSREAWTFSGNSSSGAPTTQRLETMDRHLGGTFVPDPGLCRAGDETKEILDLELDRFTLPTPCAFRCS